MLGRAGDVGRRTPPHRSQMTSLCAAGRCFVRHMVAQNLFGPRHMMCRHVSFVSVLWLWCVVRAKRCACVHCIFNIAHLFALCHPFRMMAMHSIPILHVCPCDAASGTCLYTLAGCHAPPLPCGSGYECALRCLSNPYMLIAEMRMWRVTHGLNMPGHACSHLINCHRV